MTKDDMDQIEALIKKHKPSRPTGAGCVTLLFVLFLFGAFKGCGY